MKNSKTIPNGDLQNMNVSNKRTNLLHSACKEWYGISSCRFTETRPILPSMGKMKNDLGGDKEDE